MKNYDIEIIGKLNEFVVLNPVFTWKNVNQDESFLVEIYKESSLLFNKTVASTNLSLDEFLESDTSYQIKVIGISSNHFSTLDFSTGSFSYASKNITVNNPFMNDMVIQRDEEIIFSGSAAPYQLIKVEIKNNTYYGVTNQNGKYEVVAQAHQASFDPITIKITNGIDKTTLLQNVLFGDLYLFAGQSNMQWPTNSSDYLPSDVTLAIESKVRFFAQDVVESTTKLDSVKNGRWFEINNNNYGYFSAIAFMSGSILSNALKEEVPIGIITAYQGNTNIANWMGSEYYQGNTSTKYVHYNAMIYPLRHTKISGVVWYQGENNSAQGGDYKNLLLQLFRNYRELFNSPNTPFFVIGLCSYDGDSGNNFDFSYVRESQALACMEDGNAYFISTSDGGDRFAIHPTSKRYIALRVAKSIQSVIYHKDYLAEGPMYKSHTVNGNVVIIELYNSEGLRATGKIEGLYIAGEDGKYYLAEASVVGRTIVASTSKVANPVYIKYGFEKSPFVNIF
ncbi:MAG: sialate O-acetylesterase, partial [Crenarchaeota archaeon]|nr:sialate O-acetylesterase [Thermoproteota archaeon]